MGEAKRGYSYDPGGVCGALLSGAHNERNRGRLWYWIQLQSYLWLESLRRCP